MTDEAFFVPYFLETLAAFGILTAFAPFIIKAFYSFVEKKTFPEINSKIGMIGKQLKDLL